MTSKERFLRYIAYHTTSSQTSQTSPSTERQLVLSQALAEEMRGMGLRNVYVDGSGNVIGTLPATEGAKAPVLGFIAHIDTSPDASGENVQAQEVLYDGSEIELGHGVTLSETQFPAMAALRGQVLLVTDGSTLLGADDKAGVAEIMTMAEKLIREEIPHGEIRLVFTTDEEVGRGTEGLDVDSLRCQWAYTVDGGALGAYEYENFNAAAARVVVHGVGIHPGAAKDVMKNASVIAMELHSLLPSDQVPEKTEGYEGFIHLTDFHGNVVQAELHYLIRDHDRALFEEKKRCICRAAEEICRRYGPDTAEAAVTDSYYNMREKIEPHLHLLTRAQEAFAACGVTPKVDAVRGGTDGAVLTWKGLPCPNLSAGGYNFHGVQEFIPVSSLETMSEVLVHLAYSFLEN
ncbi:MAG: peptidase T, partial [Oscillospiraceae bacterium]|nr:peptidase T [Oscillospiraceae bacterium]